MIPNLKTVLIYLLISLFFLGHLVIVILNLLQGQATNSGSFIRTGLLFWLPFFFLVTLRYRKLKKMKKEEYIESLAEGGIEEARIFRNLTDDEKDYLLKIFHGSKKNDVYLDYRSPVFKVQGKAIKQVLYKESEKNHILLKVRNQNFDETSSQDLEEFFNAIKEGDEVAIEYSPRTKHVWRMYKAKDLE